jgi:hypothetical protein
VAGPWPLVDASAIQVALAFADHEHSLSELTVSVALPPDDGSSEALFERVTWHLVAVGPVMLVVADDPQAAAARPHEISRVVRTARAESTRATYVMAIAGRREEAGRQLRRETATVMQAAGRHHECPTLLLWGGGGSGTSGPHSRAGFD